LKNIAKKLQFFKKTLKIQKALAIKFLSEVISLQGLKNKIFETG